MKVKDLIKYLQDCDKDADVVFNVKEVGNNDLAFVSEFTEYCAVKRVEISLR